MSGKKRGPPKGQGGRPCKEINWVLFEDLCGLQCTQSEICSVLKIDDNTLRRNLIKHYKDFNYTYEDAYKRFSEVGKTSLRRYQFTQARKNTSMAIFLGKNWLAQTDGREVKDIFSDDVRMEVLIEQETRKRVAAALRQARFGKSELEAEQSLLDQRSRREEDTVSA